MSLVFSKFYDSESDCFIYKCDDEVCYSNLDMSEEEVRNSLKVLHETTKCRIS